MKATLLLFVSALAFTLSSCQPRTAPNNKYSAFSGNEKAVRQAESMFSAIGGKDKWASLRSLYIKAIHTEPGIDSPYVSEIWRSIDAFKLRIEQKNRDFHNLGLFSDSGGWIAYIHRDTTKKLSEKDLQQWRYNHENNVYVLLNKLSRSGHFKVEIDEHGFLTFLEEDRYMCAVQLDEKDRPYRFTTRDHSGKTQESVFRRWQTTDGLVHSVGGGPSDDSFAYRTEKWVPSRQAFDSAYDFRMDQSAGKLFMELSWLKGTWKEIRQERNHYEYWKASEEGYSGLGFALSGADTVFKEVLQIKVEGDQLYYIPAVTGQNDGQPIPFQWALRHDHRYVFSNLQHDFPNYISYELLSKDTMRAEVYGKNKERRLSFTFERIKR